MLEPELGLAVVADGMGGHPAGNVASALAASVVLQDLRGGDPLPSPVPPQERSPSALGERMMKAVQLADARVRAAGEEDGEKAGMGTTLTALLVRADEGRATIAHVGDSRAYLYEHGRLRQLTRDDTWVQQQVDAGRLSVGEARTHPWSHVITQGIGVGEGIQPELIERDIAAGQLYLLCSDGLSGMITDVAMERLLAATMPRGLDAAAQALVDTAKEEGGLDNITVVLIRIEEG